MFRQCDFQCANSVLRGWIPVNKAIKDTEILLKDEPGIWTIIRTHGYSAENLGFNKLPSTFNKKTLNIS